MSNDDVVNVDKHGYAPCVYRLVCSDLGCMSVACVYPATDQVMPACWSWTLLVTNSGPQRPRLRCHVHPHPFPYPVAVDRAFSAPTAPCATCPRGRTTP